jgi:predicted GIY-YIG superfamily endonuclease
METLNNTGGYLYIITNPQFNGYCKIGITDDLNSRLSQYQTADPLRSYKIEFSMFHPKYKIAEKKIKEMMHYFATDIIQKGEWFRVSIPIAISRLQETLDDYNENPVKY